MTVGIIIGKLMPVHKGHVEMIRFGAEKCDTLIVCVCISRYEPIPGELRVAWVKEIFKDDPRIMVEHIDCTDFPEDDAPNREVSAFYAGYLKAVYPQAEVIISSEKYGDYIAQYMKIKHILYDKKRVITLISARMIRKNPFKYWDFIPEVVRPYFTKKVCIYGSESVGKSIIANKLAQHFKTSHVQEAARDIIDDNSQVTPKIMVEIAKAHVEKVKDAVLESNKLVFVDTDAYVTEVYSKYFLGEVPEEIFEIQNQSKYDLYLFLDCDVPWVEDPLRTCGHNRQEMHEQFKNVLERNNINYVLISGTWEERFAACVDAVEKFCKDL